MPHSHLIRLLDDDHAQWLALDRDGCVLSGPHAGLPTAAAERTVVLVPSDAVLLLAAPRVARQRQQLEQAIAFAVEEQLVAPVEQLHVAVLADLGPDTVLVAAVARERLQQWLERLAAQGLVADRLLPESSLLPDAPSLLLDGDRVCARLSPAQVLAGTVAEAEAWGGLACVHDRAGDWTVLATRETTVLPSWLGEPSPARIELAPFLAERVAQLPDSGGGLLTGSFAPRRQRLAGSRLWRIAAGVAIAGVLAGIASMALERWQLDGMHAQQRSEMAEILRQTLPGVERVVDPRAQLLGEYQRRRQAGAGGTALAMLARTAPLLSGSGRYTAEAVDFRGQTLDLTLNAADIATLDELRERIASLGYAVELSSMVPGPAGVEGKLRVRAGRP